MAIKGKVAAMGRAGKENNSEEYKEEPQLLCMESWHSMAECIQLLFKKKIKKNLSFVVWYNNFTNVAGSQ